MRKFHSCIGNNLFTHLRSIVTSHVRDDTIKEAIKHLEEERKPINYIEETLFAHALQWEKQNTRKRHH